MTGDEDLVGQTVGGCLIRAALGAAGGQGRLFRAVDLEQESIPVALKVIIASHGDNEIALRRFHREATIARLVEAHENVIRVYRAGRDARLGLPYIVMELLDGRDVRVWLEEHRAAGRLPPPDHAFDVLRQAARGVAVLHRSRAGIVHRDIKPGNLFLHRTPGATQRVKVLDFGAARVVSPPGSVAHLTEFAGEAPLTPSYASPEQNAGRSAVGPEADVFSLGVVGYELFTGRKPYTRLEEKTLARGGAPAFDPLGAHVPAPVRQAIHRALAPHPEQRFRDAGAFLEALEGTVLSSRAPLAGRWSGRKLAGPLLAALLVSTLGFIALPRLMGNGPPDDGTGGDSTALSDVPPATPREYSRVSAGGDTHACALTVEGRLLCWGDNLHGEVGNRTRDRAPLPVAVAGPDTLRFREVEAGSGFTCALGFDQQVYCWGNNAHGQLGGVQAPLSTVPRRVPISGRFSALSAGRNHACAGTPASEWYCWGGNADGQLGATTVNGHPGPRRVPGVFTSMRAGDGFTCALDLQGAILCWGRNDRGQLGDGGSHSRTRPVPVRSGHRFRDLVVSGPRACARTLGGAWHCWGDNTGRVLRVGTAGGPQRSPAPAVASEGWEEVVLGGEHACARNAGGAGWCWGANGSGQAGGEGPVVPTPHPIDPSLRFSTLSAGGARTCGVAHDRRAYCWGAEAGAAGRGHSRAPRLID